MDINISEAEWEVMRVVWNNKETTSKFVIDTLGEKSLGLLQLLKLYSQG